MPRVRLDGGVIGVTNNPTSASAGGLWSFSEHSKYTRSAGWPAASAPAGSINAIALLVAGGGAGGSSQGGGGGGGGLLIVNTSIITTSNYSIVVGAGGSYSASPTAGSGSNSTFSAVANVAIGGGGGAVGSTAAASGGSGGGAAGTGGGGGAAGSGTSGQGFAGGAGSSSAGGGGGGAGGLGNAAAGGAGAGGQGVNTYITGTLVTYGGGGAGFGGTPSSTSGGSGGGGATGNSANTNFGGGGGADNGTTRGNGGSGIVIINYPAPQQFTGGTITNVNNLAGSNIVHTFTSSGSLNALGYSIDTYFPQTTLLLHGDGTNGANNTVFLDSSTNNLTITTNGKPLQGSFSPFSQTGWSTYFNGSSDYFSTSSSTNFNCGTGDFTMEFWTFIPVTPSVNYPSIISSTNWNTGTGGVSIRYSNTGYTNKFSFHWYNVGDPFLVTPGTFAPGNWYHIALTRSGNTFTLWVNGVSQATGTNAGTVDWNLSSAGMKIGGGNWDAAASYIQMYLSNLRLVKGTAVYTSTFIPSLTPLTAIANTQFLAFQNNYFYASNTTSSVTLTPSSAPQVQPFSPFSPSSAYSNTVVGGSAYFNGSSDYLNIGSSSNIDNFTGDFCIEVWIYPTVTASDNNIIARWTTGNRSYRMYMTGTTNYIRIRYNNDTINLDSTTAVTLNTWNHVVANRSGSTFTLFLNGVSVSTATSASTIGPNSINTLIGATESASPQAFFNGYISNVRIVKGSSVYGTSNFTPPTAPLTAISNTQFLLSSTNAGIIDQTAKNTLTTYGSAAISSTQSKFGGTSMYFNGTTDYLTIPYRAGQTVFAGDYTIEAWIYVTSSSLNYNGIFTTGSETTNRLAVGFNSSRQLVSDIYGATGTFTGGTFSLNTWTHVAFVRSGSTITGYINGTSTGTASSSATLGNATGGITIGKDNSTSYFTGYIDELRISKYARYTSNFTPPTSAFLDR